MNMNAEKSKKTCKYYPHYCKHVGHSTAADKHCFMFGKSAAQKKMYSDNIEELMIEQYLAQNVEGKFILFTLAV